MNLRLPLATAAMTLALAAAAPAQTANSFKLSFSPNKAGQSAGLTESGKFDGTRIIDQLTTVLPAGTKVDTAAALRCVVTATPEASAGGYGSVCVPETKVGTGRGSATINGTAAKFTLNFYNAAKRMYVDLKVGNAVLYTSTYSINANKLVFDLGLAPKIKAKVTTFSIKIAKKGTAAEPYIRTPATCPSSRRLTASVISRAGGRSQTIRTTVPCSKG